MHAGAVDPEDGPLPDAQLKWRVTQQHGNHTHPFGDYTGPHLSFNTRTDHDADSYFTVRFTATDARGATDVKTVEIRPETVAFTLASRPAGIPMSYGSVVAPSPLARTSAIGFVATIAAPASYDLGGTMYDLLGWSDGGDRQHEVSIPGMDTTLTAAYNGHPSAAIEATPTSADLVQTLSGAGSRDPEGEGLTYAWDFGDGTTGSGERVDHHFPAHVSYPVRLTVTDPHGASSTVTRMVDVGTPAAGTALVKLSLSRSGMRLSSGGTLSFKLSNPGTKTAIGDLKLTTSKRIRVGHARAKKLTLGDGAFILASHANRTLKVKLSKTNRKLVAKLRKVPVVVTWRASERGSAKKTSGKSTSNVLAPKHKR
jgi:PKD repeat protein